MYAAKNSHTREYTNNLLRCTALVEKVPYSEIDKFGSRPPYTELRSDQGSNCLLRNTLNEIIPEQ